MVTDVVSILASIGGALGLCLGFSIWGGFNTGPYLSISLPLELREDCLNMTLSLQV